MKIAIVHDWLVTHGGAERVLAVFLELYPKADVFSIVDFLTPEHRNSILKGKYAKTTFIQKLPFAKKHFRNYLPLFPLAISMLDLRSYDLVISSSWAFAKAARTNNGSLHISYHQARNMKYIYDEKDLYFVGYKRLIKPFLLPFLKWFDKKSAKNADLVVANSYFVKNFIKEKYALNAKVIYPPVDLAKTTPTKKEDYFLVASRLVRYKRTDLVVEAFNTLGLRLIIAGNGDEMQNLQKGANKNISFVGFKSSGEILSLMQKARAFIHMGVEDFGISAVEAMNAQTPVVCFGSGGMAEIVIDGKTGLYVKAQTKDSLIEAINSFCDNDFDPKTLQTHAQNFSKEHFKKEFSAFARKT